MATAVNAAPAYGTKKYKLVQHLLRRCIWHIEQAWKLAREAQEEWNGCFPTQGGAHGDVKPHTAHLSMIVRAALKRLTGSGT